MELTILSAEELKKHLKVVSDDFQIKFQTRNQLKRKECYLADLASIEREDRGCALCPKEFSFFRRSYKCSKCSRQICSKCYRSALCLYCIVEREVFYKRKEWNILCPFEDGQFGHEKFECKDFRDKSEQEWYIRTMLEMHIVCWLKTSLDNVDIRFIIISNQLETAKRKLVSALDSFKESTPYNHIDDALSQLENSAHGTGIERYQIQSGSCTYFHLLTNAVIAAMISIKKSGATAEAVANFPKSELVPQKPTHSRSSSTSLRKKRLCHRSEFPQMQRHALNTKSSLHLQNCKNGGVERRFSKTNLAVYMNTKIVEARSGELVRITCLVQADSDDLDVKWYRGDEELPNGGRFRALSAGFRQCLEIFDCNPSDQGEIMCTAINNVSIASDIVLLSVREQDIAGEEPSFVEPLTAEEIEGNLVLKCAVTGYPVPYITFHRRSRRIHSDRQCIIERDHEKWTLKLNNCNVDDEGRYTAVARNRVGRTLSCCRVFLTHKDPETYIANV